MLEEAIERIDPAAVSEGVVVPLLNGLEHMEPLRARFGDRVAAGTHLALSGVPSRAGSDHRGDALAAHHRRFGDSSTW